MHHTHQHPKCVPTSVPNRPDVTKASWRLVFRCKLRAAGWAFQRESIFKRYSTELGMLWGKCWAITVPKHNGQWNGWTKTQPTQTTPSRSADATPRVLPIQESAQHSERAGNSAPHLSQKPVTPNCCLSPCCRTCFCTLKCQYYAKSWEGKPGVQGMSLSSSHVLAGACLKNTSVQTMCNGLVKQAFIIASLHHATTSPRQMEKSFPSLVWCCYSLQLWGTDSQPLSDSHGKQSNKTWKAKMCSTLDIQQSPHGSPFFPCM